MADIIVAEDCILQRELVVEVLRDAGHAVRAACNGRDALREFEAQPSDLVVTDLFMPDCDGIELIMALRKAKTGVPVIAMSGGYNSQTDIYLRMAEGLGASTILRKPVDGDTLLDAVARTLPLAA